MKYETIKIISIAEVKKALAALIAKEGTLGNAAQKVGVSGSMLGQVMSDKAKPGRDTLGHFGLEAKTVYVPKTKGSE